MMTFAYSTTYYLILCAYVSGMSLQYSMLDRYTVVGRRGSTDA
jgi:hypothetical protein